MRFYDARVITVRQPSLKEIARVLTETYHKTKLVNPDLPEFEDIKLQNIGAELKNALKNMVNSTKCFVHYLGWNSRYDEWLMLHKIRVDEKVGLRGTGFLYAYYSIFFKDELASSTALEALFPVDINPRLFAAAMDWCTSQEGIPSLAHTHAYTSDQQRPRRLSSSVSVNTTARVPSVKSLSETSATINSFTISKAGGLSVSKLNQSGGPPYFFQAGVFTSGSGNSESKSEKAGEILPDVSIENIFLLFT